MLCTSAMSKVRNPDPLCATRFTEPASMNRSTSRAQASAFSRRFHSNPGTIAAEIFQLLAENFPPRSIAGNNDSPPVRRRSPTGPALRTGPREPPHTRWSVRSFELRQTGRIGGFALGPRRRGRQPDQGPSLLSLAIENPHLMFVVARAGHGRGRHGLFDSSDI